jgi:hypothetical protein
MAEINNLATHDPRARDRIVAASVRFIRNASKSGYFDGLAPLKFNRME